MKDKHKHILGMLGLYVPMAFLSFIILANLYIGISRAVTHDPVPKVLGFSPLVVLSGSMEPAIHPGDVIVIKRQPLENYKVGDVVTYLDHNVIFTHRIVEHEGNRFLLKGDNNNAADDWVNPEQLEGKVVLRIPLVGRAIVFFKRPIGMGILGVFLLGFLYADELADVKNRYFSKKEKDDTA